MTEDAAIYAFCSDSERLPAFTRAVCELAVSPSVDFARNTRGEREPYRATCEVAAFAQLAQREYRPASQTWASFGGRLASGLRVAMTMVLSDDEYERPARSRAAPLQLIVSRTAFARTAAPRPRHRPWPEAAEMALLEREVIDDTFSLLAAFGHALGTASSGAILLGWGSALYAGGEAFAARFRNPEVMLRHYAESHPTAKEQSLARLQQDAARLPTILAAMAVPDEQELELNAIVARARALLQASNDVEMVEVDWRIRRRLLPPAPRWQIAIDAQGEISIVCTPYATLAPFYEALTELLLAS